MVLTLSDASTVNAGSVVGPQGPQGIQGIQGIQGVQGDAGTNGTDGADGTDGTDGISVSSATISGDNLVLTMSDASTITAGNVRGPQGTQGIQGTAGNDGAAASITVGSVTTGNAGTNATVTNAGTSSAAVFNFAIPRGAAGADGQDGADGIQLNDISVGAEAIPSGNGAITYNNGTGVFTYTPPVLSGLSGDTGDIAEGSNLYYTDGRADARISAADIGDLSDVHDATPTDGQVLTWDNANSYWKPATASGGASALTDLSDATVSTPAVGQVLRYNGVNSFVNTKLDLLDLDGISDGTNGQVLTTDGAGNFSFDTVSGGGGSAITIQDEGSALATAATTINFVGAGVTASGTGATKTITIAGGGGGGGSSSAEYFKINYATNGDVASISDTSSNVSVSIVNATAGQLEITISNYTYPPTSILLYGYVYNSNVYNVNQVDSNMTTRTLAGNGSSGSPSVFGAGNKVLTLNCSRTETGSANGSGFPPSATHAWVMFQMGS